MFIQDISKKWVLLLSAKDVLFPMWDLTVFYLACPYLPD